MLSIALIRSPVSPIPSCAVLSPVIVAEELLHRNNCCIVVVDRSALVGYSSKSLKWATHISGPFGKI